jgi:hypothetical protein
MVDTHADQLVVDNVRIFTSSLVNEMRGGYNLFFNHSGGELNNVLDAAKEAGVPLAQAVPPDAWGLPSVGIAGFSGFGDNSQSPFINRNENWQFIDNLSWSRGSHFFKFGADLRFDRYNQDGNQYARDRRQMVQHRRLRQGGPRHVRHRRPQRGDRSWHLHLRFLGVEGDSLRPPAVSRAPCGSVNVLNHPNWGEPNTTLSNVAFGRISTTRGDMRQIQFGLKLLF